MSNLELNADHEWLELVLENSSDAIIIIDHMRVIRYANKAAAHLADIQTPSALFATSYDAILAEHAIYDENGGQPDPESFPSNAALFRGVPTRNKVLRHMHRKSGKQQWLSVSSIPLFVDQETKRARYAIIFFTDISDRKLREDRVQFLIEAMKVLSITSDVRERLLEKAKLLVPLMADWCTVNLLEDDGGLERIAVVHRDPAKHKLVERLAQVAGTENVMFRVMSTGKSVLIPILTKDSLEQTFPDDEGRQLLNTLNPVSSLVVPIISDNRVLGALSLAYSDSGRIYTEDDREFIQDFAVHLGVLVENVRLYQEIEKRDKSKDSFIAALSHELRNPLAPIKSALEFLQIKNTDPDFQQTLDTIGYQFDHINQILRDLLDVNRFLQGTVSIHRKVLDIRSLLEKSVAINKAFLVHKDLSVHLSLPEEPLFIEGDETRVQQAIMNIVQNAEKFTSPGGNVWIEAKRAKDRIVVSIRDDGAGIEPGDLRILFDPYARRQSSTGLGLGLSLVRNIMRLHDGEARAESPGVGRGSTFELVFPATERMPSEQEQPALPLKDIETNVQRILIVDDNEAAGKGLAILLQHQGHVVTLAHTGMEAIRKAKDPSIRPTTLLVDIGLPDISGYEVARQLRAELGNDLLLIALTGYGQQEDIRRAHEAGFNEHLTKPVSIVDILKLFALKPEQQSDPVSASPREYPTEHAAFNF